MSRRKSVTEMQGRLSKKAREQREALENPVFAPGEPLRPQGLPPAARRAWNALVAKYEAARKLALTDTDVLLEMIEARRTKDWPRLKELTAQIESREPFPAPEPPAPVEIAAPAPAAASDCASAARQYAADVLSGAILAGPYVRQACTRFLNDLETCASRGLSFSPAAAQKCADYITALGLTLLPWEAFLVANLFGFLNAKGYRRFQNGFIEIAKKNGKTSLCGALALFMTDPEGAGENRGESYIGATSRDQARLCFEAAERLRENNSAVAGRSKQFRWTTDFGKGSFLKVLASNPERLNGRDIFFSVLDEICEHKTEDLYQVFVSSTVARTQSLVLGISTAGVDREGQIGWAQRNYALQVLSGTIPADYFFAYVAELDPEDNPDNESCWIKANPSLGCAGTVSMDQLRKQYDAALGSPGGMLNFRRYHLNVWPVSSATSWLGHDTLAKEGNAYLPGEEKLSPMERITRAEERLKRRRCSLGLDLAEKHDLSVLCILFPPLDTEGIWEALFRFYCAEQDIVLRTKKDHVPYTTWADQKYLIATPGEITDFNFIKKDIAEIRGRYAVDSLGADTHMGGGLLPAIKDDGMNIIVDVKPGYYQSDMIGRVERLFLEQRLCVHSHPIANWNFTNAQLETKENGWRRFGDKRKQRERIDASIALVNAYTRALDMAPANPYETRGILFLDTPRPGTLEI